MKRNIAVLAVAAVALAGAGFFYLSGGTSAVRAPDIAAGRAIYAQACASCHGANLQGQPNWREPGADGAFPAPPHDETGHTWHHGDKLLFDYTKLGGAEMLKRMGGGDAKSGMPGFGDRLSDDQIRDVLAFIRSTWPARVREVQAQRTEAETLKGN